MAGVSIQFDPTAFNAGKPLANFANDKIRARWTLVMKADTVTDVSINISNQDPAAQTNSRAIDVRYGSPSWFETVDEFNKLPYASYRSAIANAVEAGVLQVLDTTGSAATVANIRGGTVG